MESNRPDREYIENIIDWAEHKAWYVNHYDGKNGSVGYDLREWALLVQIMFNKKFIQINILCFWWQFDIVRDNA